MRLIIFHYFHYKNISKLKIISLKNKQINFKIITVKLQKNIFQIYLFILKVDKPLHKKILIYNLKKLSLTFMYCYCKIFCIIDQLKIILNMT